MTLGEFAHGVLVTALAMDRLMVIIAVGTVAALVVGGLVLLTKRRWVLAVACFALAATPFLNQRDAVARQDNSLAQRAAEVGAFERTPLTADYPRVLEVRSGGTAGKVLPMAWFDEVHVTGEPAGPNDSPDERVVYRWIDSPECAETAKAARTASKPWLWPDADRIDACLSETRLRLGGRRPPDAVILLQDGQTTLERRGGEHHVGGALELRVRRRGRDVLVDYWEAPYVKRPRSAALGQGMLEARSEPHERRPPMAFLKAALPGAAGTATTS